MDRKTSKINKSSRYSDDDLIDRSVFDHIRNKSEKKLVNKPNGGQNKLFAIIFIGFLVFGLLLFSNNLNFQTTDTSDQHGDAVQEWQSDVNIEYDMIVYSTPGCSCCHVYVDYLQELGYSVDIKQVDNTEGLKNELKIPQDEWSCHTMKYGDYFVEGHVPNSALQKLVQDQPDIDGITLAGMPAGSPGMGGDKTETFEIMSISHGEVIGTFVSL